MGFVPIPSLLVLLFLPPDVFFNLLPGPDRVHVSAFLLRVFRKGCRVIDCQAGGAFCQPDDLLGSKLHPEFPRHHVHHVAEVVKDDVAAVADVHPVFVLGNALKVKVPDLVALTEVKEPFFFIDIHSFNVYNYVPTSSTQVPESEV